MSNELSRYRQFLESGDTIKISDSEKYLWDDYEANPFIIMDGMAIMMVHNEDDPDEYNDYRSYSHGCLMKAINEFINAVDEDLDPDPKDYNLKVWGGTNDTKTIKKFSKNRFNHGDGRIWINSKIVSMWDKTEELTKPELKILFKILDEYGGKRNYKYHPWECDTSQREGEKYDCVLTYSEFVKKSILSSKANSISRQEEKERNLKKLLHVMDAQSKSFINKGLGMQNMSKKKTNPFSDYWTRQESVLTNTDYGVILEALSNTMSSSLKYYAFDWDDNLLFMPTEIYLEDIRGQQVAIGTKEYSELKSKLKKGIPFLWNGHTISGISKDAYINFRSEKDEQFIEEAMKAEVGPAWNDFVHAVNNGRIFSIITARGHSPDALRTAVKNLIIEGKGGLNYYTCVDSLRHMHENSNSTNEYTDEALFDRYLEKLCQFYPTTYDNEEGVGVAHYYKEAALQLFIEHTESAFKNMDVEFRNDVSNNFVIGFSDDDEDNVKYIHEQFDTEKVEVYSTKDGKMSRYQQWKNRD